MKFSENWKIEEKTSFSDKIKDKVRKPTPLKSRLDAANKRMNVQIQHLDNAVNHFSKRDKSLFAKTVKAYSQHDLVRAKVYASELSEIRKTVKHISNTKLALEQISLRLGTVSEFGDVVGLLSPSVNMLRDIGKGISGTLPEASKELGQISNLLNGIMSETHQSNQVDLCFDVPNDAAQSILDEAAQIAENNVKQQLPEVPVNLPEIKEKVQMKI
ncbi:MAG: Snf7 family protein [Candidatus Bathyarchaeota archaeon]|nr:Snf7 family protein [Candidatus Bathyarchaeum tardum]WGM88675.1 MAG: Snf7 family protein [Candidatus Bathyarchaeum tardum]